MQTMIREYKRGRVLLSERIHELDKQLANGKRLATKERDKLMLRRDLLNAERIDMLHSIVSMQQHLKPSEQEDSICKK